MKNIAECYQALLDGKTLLTQYSTPVKLISGAQNADYGEGFIPSSFSFDRPEDWQIYTKPDWREELNGKETLCWVRDSDAREWVLDIITACCKPNSYPYKSAYNQWRQCKRLTKAEVKPLMDNAPENLNGY